MRNISALLLSVSAAAMASPALAQEPEALQPEAQDSESPAQVADEAQESDAIVVTGVAQGRNRLDASVSTTSLDDELIQQVAPRSSAELLRNIPGIRAESSGGEGNANINVRGLPVSTGGAKFLQLQEDGLPVLEFGDIIFGNADIFTRVDTSIARVESIRGGSASTFTSNAPGGIVNFITRDGSDEGGSMVLTAGVDYPEYRIDFQAGGNLRPGTRFHVGGFYRIGEGPRDAGYDANRGGQIRLSLTQDIGESGYIRATLRHLDDRAISYLPSPVRVTGTNADPDYVAIPNLDPANETIHSRYFRLINNLDRNNRPTVDDVADGMHPVLFSAGLELNYDLSERVNFTNRFRYSDISGRFISPFPAGVDSAQNVANSVGGPGSTLFFATGPNAGRQITNPAGLNGNGLIIPIVMFNTQLNSLDNIVNDARLNFDLNVGAATVRLTGGLYYSRQDIATTWLWTSHLLAADGSDAELIDVRNAAGVLQTYGGTVAYGASFFGNCCRRQYDLEYTTLAPFASIGVEIGRLNVDASVRFDFGDASGSALADGPVRTVDVNGDGVIQAPETRTTVLAEANRRPIGYDYDYTSYSLGATYRLSDASSVFARYSRGARANADRLIFGPAITAAGGIADPDAVVDFVNQAEAGFKYRQGPLQFYLTGFHSRTEETNFDFGLGFFSNRYRAYGLEAEGSARFGIFQISASGTYTDAEITEASASPTLVGNRPRRQAAFVYQVTPQLVAGRFNVGANVVGTTDSFAQDSNQLVLPGFTQVNGFASFQLNDQIGFSVNVNNLFDVTGFTEAEEGAIPANGFVRARSINGRSISASARINF